MTFTGPCSVLLPGQAVPVGVSASDCHLSTGQGRWSCWGCELGKVEGIEITRGER